MKLLLPGVHDPGEREVVVHYPHRRYLAPRVRVVVDSLLDHFRRAADLHLSVGEVAAQRPDCVAGAVPAAPARSAARMARPRRAPAAS